VVTVAFNRVTLQWVLLLSIVAVIKMVRHGRLDPHGQTATMPKQNSALGVRRAKNT
jgi:hypothetical protein